MAKKKLSAVKNPDWWRHHKIKSPVRKGKKAVQRVHTWKTKLKSAR